MEDKILLFIIFLSRKLYSELNNHERFYFYGDYVLLGINVYGWATYRRCMYIYINGYHRSLLK